MTDITLDRPAPVLGGFTPAYLRLELVRKLRNPRGLFFTVAFPVLMFFIVGYQALDVPLTRTPVAAGGVSVAAYIMVSMAMYGAMMSATQTGASVAVERAQGWTRQLRLTPLHPLVNVAVKTAAERFNTSEGTIRMTLHRALTRIAAMAETGRPPRDEGR